MQCVSVWRYTRAGALDEKKDGDKLRAAFEPYRPYRSVASWYMWRLVDTPSFLIW